MIQSGLQFIAHYSPILWAIDITVLAAGIGGLAIGLAHLWKGQQMHSTVGE